MIAVPFTDLAAIAGEVRPEIERDFTACLLDGAYVGGPAVTAFERAWAAYCGAEHAVGVASGTDALHLSLTALGVGAILLSGKLAHLDAWTERRIALASRYRDLLGGTEFAGTGLTLPAAAPRTRHVYHLFVVRVARRDGVRAELARRGIQTGVHYPVPCHRQLPLRRFAERPLPVAEQSAGELLSLPMFPHLTDRQVDFVCESLCGALRAATAGSEFADVR